MDVDIRLTALAHGGGCGCKLAPSVLHQLLANTPASSLFPNLLVGTETSDDAAVYRLNDSLAVVATTDFFTPIVDDPFHFGRIAATNALSDVYAMGGTPIMALAILGMPVATLGIDIVQQILAGGRSVCAAAISRSPAATPSTVPSPSTASSRSAPFTPDRILRNTGAQPGDALILIKPLGVGIFSAALKQGRLGPADYATLLTTTTQLNRIGPGLAALPGIHACTDVTGFGLLGHVLELARGSALRAELDLAAIPILPGAAMLAESGLTTGAGARNWSSYGASIDLPPDLAALHGALLCDPQTSGGLLIAAAPGTVSEALRLCHEAGFTAAAIIGRLHNGPPGIAVR